MSTPRKPRKGYKNLPREQPSPLSLEEFQGSVLTKCGVDDKELQRVTKKAWDELDSTLGATTLAGEVDHAVRLRAVDMTMKLAGAYPKTGGTGTGVNIYMEAPAYYKPPVVIEGK